MNRTISTMILGIATAATLALAGCSSPTPEETTATTDPSQSPMTNTEPAADPSEPAEPSSAVSTELSPSEGEDTKGADNSARPSKEEIVDGLTQFYVNEQDLAQDTANAFAICMVDEVYDEADVATLEALRDGNPAGAAEDDTLLIANSGETCGPALN